MVREIVIILAMTTVPGAETIGDFAPLEVGNVWVYDVVKRIGSGHFGVRHEEVQTGTFTASLIREREAGDTSYYYFETHMRYSAIIDSFIEDRSWSETKEHESTGTDSLFVWADTVRSMGRSEIVPVWYTHTIESEDETVDSLKKVNGVYGFMAEKNGTVPPVYPVYHIEFSSVELQAGTGVTRYFYAGGIDNSGYDVTFELSSFTGKQGSNVSVFENRSSDKGNRRTVLSRAALPNVTVSRNGLKYNLLGREYTDKYNRKVNQSYRWHECLFDLFQ